MEAAAEAAAESAAEAAVEAAAEASVIGLRDVLCNNKIIMMMTT